MNFARTSISSSLSTNRTKSSTNDSTNYLNCFSVYDDIVYVSSKNRLIIIVFYLIIFIINTITNGLCIYVNVITNQWKNQSMKVVLFISTSDVLSAVFGNASHITLISILNELDCPKRRFLILVPHLFSYFSTYSVLFLGLDRFLHVMLLDRYNNVIGKIRFYFLFQIYLVVGLEQAILTTFGPSYFGENGGASYSAPVNSLFISITIAIYIASIIKLRIYTKNSTVVSAKTSSLSRLASAFLTIITITYSPLILSTVFANKITETLGDANTNIMAHSLLLWAKCNSCLNAIAYLRLNTKARRRVNTMIQQILVGNKTET